MTTSSGLLTGLDDEQRAAVTSTSAPVLVIAPAGSGKTRVLTRRIAHRVLNGEAEASRVVAVTFTRKAARELIDRLAALEISGPRAGTFHSLAYSALRAHLTETGKPLPQRVITSKARILLKLPIMKSLLASNKGEPRMIAGEIATEIEWAKVQMVPAENYVAAAAGRKTRTDATTIAAVFEAYETAKKKQRSIDFEDMLALLLSEIERDRYLAAEIRAKWRHLHVDEFQDVNPLQFRLLRSVLAESDDLFAVGDPMQSIYSFAGADPKFMATLVNLYDTTEVIRLRTNYRSTPAIVRTAQVLVEADPSSTETRPHTRADRNQAAALPDTFRDAPGPLPAIWSAPSGAEEARRIAREIRDAFNARHGWRASAVLVRTRAQTGVLAEALDSARVPFEVRGEGGFAERTHIRRALRAVESGPASPNKPIAARLEDVLEQAEPEAEAADDLEALLDLAREFDALNQAGPTSASHLSDFVTWLAAERPGDDEYRRKSDVVSVMTLHAAKGLEFRSVWVAGLEEGLLPVYHAQTRTALAEERRLFYVGLTRATQRLTMSWARERTFDKSSVERQPSRFLQDVREVVDELRASEVPTLDWGGAIAEKRREIAAARSTGKGRLG